ncbi:MAG: outer membrane beta-barrel protein [Pseudomonadota bacterium]
MAYAIPLLTLLAWPYAAQNPAYGQQVSPQLKESGEGHFSSLFRLDTLSKRRSRAQAEPAAVSTLRGVELFGPLKAIAPASSEVSYVQPAPNSPAQTPTQGQVRGVMNPLERRSTQAPVYDPYSLSQPVMPPENFRARKRSIDEEDPYAPLGLRRGGFIVRPSVEASFGADSNVNRTPTGAISSGYTRLRPEIAAESDWSRHQLTMKLGAERYDYFSGGLDARSGLDAEMKGRIDIRRGTTLELGASYDLTQDGSALTTSTLPGTATGRPNLQTLDANAALKHSLGRIGFELRGDVANRDFGDTPVSSGPSISNDERDVVDSKFAARTSYEWTASLKPFLETEYNRHDYNITVDTGGFQKGSDGVTERAGVMFDFAPFFTGELALGLLYQTPFEPTASSYTGFTFDGNVAWTPTELTTVRVAASTKILDDALVGAIGGVSHDTSVAVEHALRRNVTLNGSIGFGIDDYEGITRNDHRVLASIGTAWKLNRYAQLQTRIEHGSLFSSVAGEDVSGTLYETGLKLQY